MSVEKLSQQEINIQLEGLGHRGLKHWRVAGNKLERNYVFDDFKRAFNFMTKAAVQIENINHHPQWSNSYNKVSVSLTTHEVGGLTTLDFSLAKVLDDIAATT